MFEQLQKRLAAWQNAFRAWYEGSLVNRATLKGQLLVGGMLIGVFGLSFWLVSEQIRKSVDERLDAVASLNALRVQSALDRVLGDLESLSRRTLVANALADSAGNNAYLRPFLAENQRNQPETHYLAVVDSLGSVLASAETAPIIDQALIDLALQAGQPRAALRVQPGESRLGLAYPVHYDATGRMEGVLVAEVDLKELLQRTELQLATRDGLPLIVSVVDAARTFVFASADPGKRETLEARVPLAGKLSERGIELQLVVSADRAAAYAPLLYLAGGMAIVAALAAALIVFMTRKMSETIVGPLAEMSHRAMEIAGSGPTGLRELPVTRCDEIGWMGTAFNEMVFSLRQVYDSQEREVRRRTEELAEARERLSGVLASVDDMIYACDPAFANYDYISPAVVRVFGLNPECVISEPARLRDMVLDEDRPGLEAARLNLRVGASTEVRYRIRRTDGHICWLLDRFHLVTDESGHPLRVAGLLRDVTATVMAEASLLLRDRALASSSCGVVITDMLQPGQPILYVNAAFERITGYTADEVLGRNCAFLQGGVQGNEGALEEIRAAIPAGRECKVVIRNVRKDGELFWNELQLSPLQDERGRVTHYIGVQNDISSTIASTQALVESEQRLALTIAALHEGVWDWSIEDDVLFTSPSWAGILGLDPVVLGANSHFSVFLDQVPETWRARVREELDAYLAGAGDDFYLEHPMCHADGRQIWVASHGRVVERSFEGQPQRMVGTIVDITQRIESSQQIIGLMSQLDSIFTLSPDAFLYFNDQGIVSFVNPAFERLTGIKAGDASGLSREAVRSRLWDNCDPAQAFPAFDEGSDDGQDGQLMYLIRPQRRVLLVSRRGGSGCAAVIYMRDVTRETEVDRMKSEFLTTAAHELRTPMASIMGFAELLMLREFPPERTKDMLSTVHRQARRLTDLINELLDLARIEARAGKDFKIARHQLEPLVRDAMAAFQVDGDRSRMRLHLPDELPEIDLDPAKMQQAIINLLSNAYKYSPKGGAVDVTVCRRNGAMGEQVGIVVRDHGIGMTPEETARVFERFFRADPSGNIPGTGLGMSLVKEIMDTHGGQVEVDSELGQGTAVSLWLPVAAAQRTANEANPAGEAPAAHGELTLWLADPVATPETGATLH